MELTYIVDGPVMVTLDRWLLCRGGILFQLYRNTCIHMYMHIHIHTGRMVIVLLEIATLILKTIKSIHTCFGFGKLFSMDAVCSVSCLGSAIDVSTRKKCLQFKHSM